MYEIKRENFKNYSKDIFDIINYFKNNEIDTNIIMKNLEGYIFDGSARVAGHVFDNQLKSFIWCYPRIYDGSRRLHISYFYVSKEHRGKGFSSDLLQYARELAKIDNINFIDLNVDPNNDRALNIYKKSGFKTEKLQLILSLESSDR